MRREEFEANGLTASDTWVNSWTYFKTRMWFKLFYEPPSLMLLSKLVLSCVPLPLLPSLLLLLLLPSLPFTATLAPVARVSRALFAIAHVFRSYRYCPR